MSAVPAPSHPAVVTATPGTVHGEPSIYLLVDTLSKWTGRDVDSITLYVDGEVATFSLVLPTPKGIEALPPGDLFDGWITAIQGEAASRCHISSEQREVLLDIALTYCAFGQRSRNVKTRLFKPFIELRVEAARSLDDHEDAKDTLRDLMEWMHAKLPDNIFTAPSGIPPISQPSDGIFEPLAYLTQLFEGLRLHSPNPTTTPAPSAQRATFPANPVASTSVSDGAPGSNPLTGESDDESDTDLTPDKLVQYIIVTTLHEAYRRGEIEAGQFLSNVREALLAANVETEPFLTRLSRRLRLSSEDADAPGSQTDDETPSSDETVPHNQRATPPAPAVIAPAPAIIVPAPTIIAPAPAVVAPVPAIVAHAPALVAPTPALIAPAPAVVAPTPAVIAPAPAIVAPVPPIIAPAPPVVAQPPAHVAGLAIAPNTPLPEVTAPTSISVERAGIVPPQQRTVRILTANTITTVQVPVAGPPVSGVARASEDDNGYDSEDSMPALETPVDSSDGEEWDEDAFLRRVRELLVARPGY